MRTRVLVLAGGASWEAEVLAGCADVGLVVVGRCVDVVDLMAAATLGQAELAVVSAELARLDRDTVAHLIRCDLQVLVVGGDDRFRRWGATPVVADPAAILRVASAAGTESPRPAPTPSEVVSRGRALVVWGPTGAPGRSTVAVTLAAELAERGRRVVLVDADPYGGSVAQQLGILDESSGLLAAARHVGADRLDARSLAGCCRQVGPGLAVLTGLPRADRRIEVRTGWLGEILAVATELGDVVVDTGPTLDDERNDRDRMTREALDVADEVVVVGAADPVGLARLARGLVALAEVRPSPPARVVVNRVRSGLGWDPDEVRSLVAGFGSTDEVRLVPESRACLDRSLVAGRSLVELGDSAVRRALAGLVEECFPEEDQAPKSR